MIELGYMGTKQRLAPVIADLICQAKPGIVLDAFSGMCAVGTAVGERRPMWNNDVEVFAAGVARSLFIGNDSPPNVLMATELLFDYFATNRTALCARFRRRLGEEREALDSVSIVRLRRYLKRYANFYLEPKTQKEVVQLAHDKKQIPYRLFTLLYADSYFGLYQCIEIDSIVFSLDQAVRSRKLTEDQRLWLILCLGAAVKRIATTTGHFAQFLEPSEQNVSRFRSQRNRSVWEAWIEHIPDQAPLGSSRWRRSNRVFNEDTLELLPRLKQARHRPSVVYADPPYTDDQYSRYYHILDTLIRYDYPLVSGKARYCSERFQTPFSLKKRAINAFDALASTTLQLGADLIISYPQQGLLHQLGVTPYSILRKNYRRVELWKRVRHSHSTLGASKGPAMEAVTESIYWARA